VRDPVTIVGVIKKHQISQDWDRAWRNQRRIYGDGESTRAAVVGDGESVTEKWHKQIFLPTYCTFLPQEVTTHVAKENSNREPVVVFLT
jgi:hypothetical protein